MSIERPSRSPRVLALASARSLGGGLAALLLAGGLVAPSNAGATILTFDQTRRGADVVPTESGGSYPTDYGDGVTGPSMGVSGGVYTYGEAGEGFTPDVTIEITSSLATATDAGVRLWGQGYGDLLNVVFTEGPGTAGAPLLFVRLVASPGFEVDLYGFDLAYFGAASTTIAGVSVLSGSTELFGATDVVVAGSASTPGHTSVAFATPLSAAELLVRIDLSNIAPGSQDNVGLDNLRFGQTPPGVVPEPGTAVLVLAGLAVLAGRRR
ncbi:MAG: PEP-CTERM sorting domain-containing protein [Myxococcota bacterium]